MNHEKLNINKVLYLVDENGIFYCCFNCIFGFKLKEELKIYSAPIEYILENVLTDERNVETNKLFFRTSMPKKFSLYITNLGFKYDKDIEISINRLFDNDNEYVLYIENTQKYIQRKGIYRSSTNGILSYIEPQVFQKNK